MERQSLSTTCTILPPEYGGYEHYCYAVANVDEGRLKNKSTKNHTHESYEDCSEKLICIHGNTPPNVCTLKIYIPAIFIFCVNVLLIFSYQQNKGEENRPNLSKKLTIKAAFWGIFQKIYAQWLQNTQGEVIAHVN